MLLQLKTQAMFEEENTRQKGWHTKQQAREKKKMISFQAYLICCYVC